MSGFGEKYMPYALHLSAFEALKKLFEEAQKTYPKCSLVVTWGCWAEQNRGVVVVGLYRGDEDERAPLWRTYQGVRISIHIPENIEGAPKEGVLCFTQNFFFAPKNNDLASQIIEPDPLLDSAS